MTADATSTVPRSLPLRAIIALSAANALEWFDFIVFGYFAATIARNFFPTEHEATSLLLSLATFGVAFFVRPLGAIVLGRFADRRGRKPALLLTISLMVAGTGLIALAPPYEVAGVVAPMLVVCGRLLQGFSVGGEFGGTTAYLVEQTRDRRGLLGSSQFAGQALAALLANLCGVVLTYGLTAEQLSAWGWRIPFVLGLLIVLVAYAIRRRLAESPEFTQATQQPVRMPQSSGAVVERLLFALGFVMTATVTTYTLVYMPSFAASQLGLPLSAAFQAGLLTSALQAVVIPLAGLASDRWGHLRIACLTLATVLLVSYPLFSALITAPSLATLLAFQVIVGSVIAVYGGPLPALMSDLFPTRMRTTGLSISYAVSVSVFGGLSPLVSASLTEWTGSKIAPIYYVMFAAAVSLSCLLAARWRRLY